MKNPFLSRPWRWDESLQEFKVGSCHGLWQENNGGYQIIAITNESKGNGDFQDVLDWFEQSCRRDKKTLEFMEIWNDRLKKHLLEKRGFVLIAGTNNARKTYAT